ncbi:MAG: hypothetical protein IIY04_01115 [Oscillospiraceae bacterium]|nr:hypothetical protein [Oscillospiraceae bacterium]
MRKAIICVIWLLLLTMPIFADDLTMQQAEMIGTQSLTDGLDDDARQMIGDLRPDTVIDFPRRMIQVIGDSLVGAFDFWPQTCKTLCALMAAIIFCAMIASAEHGISLQAQRLAGALAIAGICTANMSTMIGLAQETIGRISSFTSLLLPVMASAVTASGGIGSGAALYIGSAVFFDVMMKLVQWFLVPMVLVFAALAAADCAAGEGRLTKIRELIGWVIGICLKGIVYLFTAYLALTGIISGAADAVALKAAKAAISVAIPVVGGIVSNASESVLAGAQLLKNTTGVFGLVSIAAIGLTPFLRIALSYLGLKLAAAVGGTIGQSEYAKLIGHLSSALGYMLAMTGCCILMAAFSCCCFMKAVSG